MGFESVPGLPGRVYVPERAPEKRKKHSCRDCFSCEFCSDDRCGVCRSGRGDDDCQAEGECGIGDGDTLTELGGKR